MTWRSRAAALLREPLVHFLVAGALVFAVLSGRPAETGDRRIVVSEAVATRLVERWAQAFRRQPSEEEIDGLIRDWVRDQVYYREALRLGLDRDDEVVIKRMRNKMIALAAAEAEAREPSDAELEALLARDPARYAGEPRTDFEQLYFGGDRAAAEAALAQGRLGADGTPSPLPRRFTSVAGELVERFGDDFAAALAKVPPGRWYGPIESGLGFHLVRIARHEAPPPASVGSIRQRLTNDWRAAALRKAEDDGYRRMLDAYEVVIEKPAPAAR